MKIINKILKFSREKISIIITGAVFIAYTLVSFGFYHARTLDGDINNHILSADMFGVPGYLKERGIKTFYNSTVDTGWDGQFYYYMSNDILALNKDTASHIDSPSYRYQRIGLSLYVATIAKIIGSDWVSPKLYISSYLLLVYVGTIAGAIMFYQLRMPPALILLWSLNVGTQITLFNALPDAAADSFLIIALTILYARKSIKLSVIPFIFAALSREVYALFPTCILFIYLFDLTVKSDWASGSRISILRRLLIWREYYLLGLPAIFTIAWQLYIINHFGVAPSSQAHGVLGLPLVAWGNYFYSAINGVHSVAGAGIYAYAEAASLLLFVLILSLCLLISIDIYKIRYREVSQEARGLALASLCLVFLYACFGATVMMYYTGYFKAVAVFFFLIPLLFVNASDFYIKKSYLYILLVCSFIITTFYNMKVRILPFAAPMEQYTKISKINETRKIECFSSYEAIIDVKNIEVIKHGVASRLFGNKDKLLINLEIKNTGGYPLVSSTNSGGVFMSYQWVNSMGDVVMDGTRTAIPEVMKPGDVRQVSVVSYIPDQNALLKLSPVQEGCSWFYINNPGVSQNINFKINK